ncbi:transcriptional regulator, partial [Streptomyces sp. SID5926]|nr:transcriptional regulator [Streptomyces sp. SID5926]
ETRARRRAIGHVLLATAQVQQREIEQACNTATKAVELLETLRSNRGAEYLDDFQARLEPYREEAVVREFGARLDLQAAA